MRKKMLCDARFEIEIDVRGPVLIKSGEAGLVGPDMAFVRSYAYGQDEPAPFLPGTSLKGVFRSHVERIARTLKPGCTPVCLPYDFQRGPEQSCGQRFERGTPKTRIYREQCLACRLFGSLAFKGRMFLSDGYANDPSRLVIEQRDGVAIDRKTGGSANGALYDLQVLTRGTFTTTLILDNFESWQLGALALVLLDLADERVRIGTGTSRGLGRVRGQIVSAELRYPPGHDGRFCGIERLASADEIRDYGLFRSERVHGELGESAQRGIWNCYHLDETARISVFDAARDDFLRYLEAYRWDGGYRS